MERAEARWSDELKFWRESPDRMAAKVKHRSPRRLQQ
jgi:hypothetical protein